MSNPADIEKFTNDVISWFNQAYYFNKQQTWFNTFWRGVHVHKCPTDLWVYQEILHETKPTVIVETGTANGGSALYLAQFGELLGGVRVITVDITNDNPPTALPVHPSITYLTGSSTDASIVGEVRKRLEPDDRVMVILDSDHREPHVRAELEIYPELVTPGCYLIVEDTNVNGHPVYPTHGPGPMEAVAGFLPGHPEFVVDRGREKFMLTFNPSGYLRRK
jgi:cephalosporin hydroxylase